MVYENNQEQIDVSYWRDVCGYPPSPSVCWYYTIVFSIMYAQRDSVIVYLRVYVRWYSACMATCLNALGYMLSLEMAMIMCSSKYWPSSLISNRMLLTISNNDLPFIFRSGHKIHSPMDFPLFLKRIYLILKERELRAIWYYEYFLSLKLASPYYLKLWMVEQIFGHIKAAHLPELVLIAWFGSPGHCCFSL